MLSHWVVSGQIYYHLSVTLFETAMSFVIGAALGFICGLVLALNPFYAVVSDPFLKAFNAMPRVVLAPIFAVWFGLGVWSKIMLGVTLVFFITFFNVMQGIREVNRSPSTIAASLAPAARSWSVTSISLRR